MKITIHTEEGNPGTDKRQQSRSLSRKLLKDFERQYIARNQDPYIHL